MKNLFLFVFLLFSFGLFSQESPQKLLQGRIIFSSMNQSPINILNLTQNTGTTNDQNGNFEIEVKLGDELLFSSVQYMPYQIHVDEELLKMKSIIVELVPSITKLEQVTISNIDLSGNLAVDAGSVETKIVYDNQTLGFPPPSPKIPIETRRLYTMTTGHLDVLVGAISGELKRLKKIQRIIEKQALVQKASRSLETVFFVKECKIPEEYLIDFMYFCATNDNFKYIIGADHKLDLVEFFKEKAGEYRKRREWE